MDVPPPTAATVRDLAESFGFDLTDEDVEFYQERIATAVEVYGALDAYDNASIGPNSGEMSERTRQDPDEDRLNCWITKCDLAPTETGSLDGWSIGVKDGINIAGLPSTSGSRVFEDAVPDYDATVVVRLLDAGAQIVGKTNMDAMGNSGDGSSSDFGAILNPADLNHLAGGSSGGSAAAVADGQVDAALGTDSGGSVRAPAAWCGVVGYKPTHGLIPYTGCSGLDQTIDHVGPLAPDVETAARLVSVLAGTDDFDGRQPRQVPTRRYEDTLDSDPSSFSVGVLAEGFTRPGNHDGVSATVRDACDGLKDAGATVEEVSIPIHEDGQLIQGASTVLGMVDGYRRAGQTRSVTGWQDEDRVRMFHERTRKRADEVPASMKNSLLLGSHIEEAAADPALYARLMNLRRLLEARYDEALTDHDVLALPTTPMPAYEHHPESTRGEWLDRSLLNLSNTSPFNATGHPAVSVPVGSVDGLPVGLQLVGTHFEDATVLDAAASVEALVEGRRAP